jgi:hypothetical protein
MSAREIRGHTGSGLFVLPPRLPKAIWESNHQRKSPDLALESAIESAEPADGPLRVVGFWGRRMGYGRLAVDSQLPYLICGRREATRLAFDWQLTQPPGRNSITVALI